MRTEKQVAASRRNWLLLRLRGAESAIEKAASELPTEEAYYFKTTLGHLRTAMHQANMVTAKDKLEEMIKEI